MSLILYKLSFYLDFFFKKITNHPMKGGEADPSKPCSCFTTPYSKNLNFPHLHDDILTNR